MKHEDLDLLLFDDHGRSLTALCGLLFGRSIGARVCHDVMITCTRIRCFCDVQ